MKRLIYILIAIIIIAFSIYQISMIDNCVTPDFESVDYKNPFNNFLNKVEKIIDDTTLPNFNATESSTEFTEPTYATSNTKVTYAVERVVDGDTIIANIDGESIRIRFIGIDTPESVNSDDSKNCEYGKVSSKYTKKLLTGKKVSLVYDTSKKDIYGRTLAYVYLGNEMVNYNLVANGYAVAKEYVPNTKYSSLFTYAQIQAEKNKVGMWSDKVTDEQCNLKSDYYISY
jgi:micrococcal nuclease